MRAVVQRVSSAQVTVAGEVVGQIERGFLVLVGITHRDGEAEAHYLARKIVGLRVFEDDGGKMNLGLTDIGGAVLAVSQFTLYGDVRKGRRPASSTPPAPNRPSRSTSVFASCWRRKAWPSSRASSRRTCRFRWSTTAQ